MLNNIIDLSLLTRFFTNLKTYIAELLATKQDLLVSGTNIKTINGASIIGNGSIITGIKQLYEVSTSSIELKCNAYYRIIGQPTSLVITLSDHSNDSSTITMLNEYIIEFTTAAAGTTISLPNTIKWANGQIPTFEANATYQISIVNNLGVCIKFA